MPVLLHYDVAAASQNISKHVNFGIHTKFKFTFGAILTIYEHQRFIDRRKLCQKYCYNIVVCPFPNTYRCAFYIFPRITRKESNRSIYPSC